MRSTSRTGYPLPVTSALALATILAFGACSRQPDAAEDSGSEDVAAITQETGTGAGEVPTDPMPTGAPAPANAEMQAVLDQLAKLGGKPVETLSPDEARKQPSPADAVKALLQSQGQVAAPEVVASVEDSSFPGPGGPVAIRIYKPAGDKPLPVVLYVHGGGWVIADLDTYDASPRAIANAAQAIVVSTHYRQGPEHKFPAAHDDVLAAYEWLLANAGKLGGDPTRIGVVGESAGGNMAANVAITARDQGWQAPLVQVLVYPVADNDLNSPSYLENASAKPLNKPMIEWFVKHYLNSPEESADPRIALVKQPNLADLAPATIILAQIDPLRSDGEKYAEKLKAAGTPVTVHRYDAVTHEFFGMGAVVGEAKSAQQVASEALKTAFGTR